MTLSFVQLIYVWNLGDLWALYWNRWQYFSILILFEVSIMVDQLIPCTFKQLYRTNIVIFNLSDHFIPAMHSQHIPLDITQHLLGIPLPAVLLRSYHDVYLRLVRLNPAWKEEVDVSDHLLLVVEDDEDVFVWIGEPGTMVLCLFLDGEQLWGSEF